MNREFEALADDFIELGLLPEGSNREEIVPALTGVFEEALKGGVSNLSFGELSGNLGRWGWGSGDGYCTSARWYGTRNFLLCRAVEAGQAAAKGTSRAACVALSLAHMPAPGGEGGAAAQHPPTAL